jgi:hypothetical protein
MMITPISQSLHLRLARPRCGVCQLIGSTQQSTLLITSLIHNRFEPIWQGREQVRSELDEIVACFEKSNVRPFNKPLFIMHRISQHIHTVYIHSLLSVFDYHVRKRGSKFEQIPFPTLAMYL